MSSEIIYQQSNFLSTKKTMKICGEKLIVICSSLLKKRIYAMNIEALNPLPIVSRNKTPLYLYVLLVPFVIAAITLSVLYFQLSDGTQLDREGLLGGLIFCSLVISAIFIKLYFDNKKHIYFLNQSKQHALIELNYQKDPQKIQTVIDKITAYQSKAAAKRIEQDEQLMLKGIEKLNRKHILNDEQCLKLRDRMSMGRGSLFD